MKRSNEETVVWLLIESEDAVKNIDDILNVEGIHALMLGPFDLAQAMGFPGQTGHPAVVEACASIAKKAKSRNIEVVATIFSATAKVNALERQRWINLGVRILVAGTDRRIVMNAMKDNRAVIRAHLASADCVATRLGYRRNFCS